MNVPLESWICFLCAYFVMGMVTFAVYAFDKRHAKTRGRRVRESTLHLLEIAWGVMGAIVAQRLLHHKNRKKKFFVVTYTIAALHAAALIALLVIHLN